MNRWLHPIKYSNDMAEATRIYKEAEQVFERIWALRGVEHLPEMRRLAEIHSNLRKQHQAIGEKWR